MNERIDLMDILKRLDEAGSTGADLSPGDPLCAAAAIAIRQLIAERNWARKFCIYCRGSGKTSSWDTNSGPPLVQCECRKVTTSTQVPVAPNTNGWISVETQIPEYNVRVLVHSKKFGVITGHRQSQTNAGNSWELGMRDNNLYSMYYHAQSTGDVTHWRPMPSVPTCE